MNKLLVALLTGAILAGCAERGEITMPEPGVALELARFRAQSIANVHYGLALQLPADLSIPMQGTVNTTFLLRDASAALVLDFRAPEDHIKTVRLNGVEVDYIVSPDHIVIPAHSLRAGEQELEISFISTDSALNRQTDFMYSLFVPDRASTAFPVFEQPDIKARFSLTLDIPAGWQALSNGELLARDTSDPETHKLRFAETLPISTYLFAFAAGAMEVATATRDGRHFELYHRETDPEKLSRNLDAIFDLHATALHWLEDYTGIAYPFDKFAFFAIPSFQFGGMEHPGAVWYRAPSLFLDPTASRTQELSRASLIAHETAHMWFGDLVTMEWFNDVWMKEVFANFMAAKIAEPAFPDLNLDLRFFQAHHPAAYNVDRTAGTNAIRQSLDNLNDAGSLYGAIIYQKAPIVINQLEALIGEVQLRDGLRRYLSEFAYGNASWPDLIGILDTMTDEDLTRWSEVWVTAAGRPRVNTTWEAGGITLRATDGNGERGLLWNQPLVIAVGHNGIVSEYHVQMRDTEAFIGLPAEPDFMFAGADGVGYGRFVLDDKSRHTLLQGAPALSSPLHRSVVWQTLWEEVLDSKISAIDFVTAAIEGVAQETDELVAQQLLGLLGHAFWQFLEAPYRDSVSTRLESVLWSALERAETPGRKGAYFNALVSMTLTSEGIERLASIWQGDEEVAGMPLQEQQFITLAEALVLRNISNADTVMSTQEQRISNPDRAARFGFLQPALGNDNRQHQELLASFSEVAARRNESWVLDAMAAIHHPVRNEGSRFLLRESLDLTAEIHRTGDIFFPLNWLNATLEGYQSPEAASIVQDYLDENPDLPLRLRGKILQAADDLLFRQIPPYSR